MSWNTPIFSIYYSLGQQPIQIGLLFMIAIFVLPILITCFFAIVACIVVDFE